MANNPLTLQEAFLIRCEAHMPTLDRPLGA